MNNKLLFGLVLSSVLTGCATPPQKAVSFDPLAFSTHENRIGIAMDEMPDPSLSLPGASCLLCIAVASAANSSLSSHVKTLAVDELASLKQEIATILSGQGRNAVVINEPLGVDELEKVSSKESKVAKFEFSAIQKAHQIDQLLVVDLNHIGATRPYSSYVPSGAPRATIKGAVFLIDLHSKTYQWYLPLNLQQGADGPWDEPPEFPGISNAYYQVVERARDRILAPLSAPAVTASAP